MSDAPALAAPMAIALALAALMKDGCMDGTLVVLVTVGCMKDTVIVLVATGT